MGIIRLLLAISVVVYHSRPLLGQINFLPGSTAVQAFFIISGFYMSLVINEKYEDKQSFYRARLLKIFPVYWAIVAVSIYLTGYFLPWLRYQEGVISLSSLAYFT